MIVEKNEGGKSMNKKKVVACLLAATMATGMLAGCGGSSGSSDSSSSSSGGKDKLTFWFPTFASADGEVTDEEFWNEKMDAFEEENNCEVNVEIIPWDNYEEKYLTGVNSNDGPDADICTWKCSMTTSTWEHWQTSMNISPMMRKQIISIMIWVISRVDSMHCL